MKCLYIYKKSRHFSKSKTICVTFLFTQKTTLYVTRFFHEKFEIGIYIYTKIMTLCVTWRLYIQKARYFEKARQFGSGFFNTKSLTLCFTRFSWDLWNWRRRGGGGYMQKNNALFVTFLYAKNNALSVAFIYIYNRHSTSHFYMQKKMHFALSFYI